MEVACHSQPGNRSAGLVPRPILQRGQSVCPSSICATFLLIAIAACMYLFMYVCTSYLWKSKFNILLGQVYRLRGYFWYKDAVLPSYRQSYDLVDNALTPLEEAALAHVLCSPDTSYGDVAGQMFVVSATNQ